MTTLPQQLTLEETKLPDDPAVLEIVSGWLARGDGVAVYENQDLGHPELGHRKFVSFGSGAAQLETDRPPERLPDIGDEINWRYCLVGVYRPTNEHAVHFGTLQPDGSVTNTKIIKQSDIRRCPHVILSPRHYRDDGTCRCDDPSHHEMKEWGYVWDTESERWV